MKRFSIGTLFIGILAHCVISTLFLASCVKDNGQTEQPTGQTTGRTIRKELTLQTIPMESTVGEGATRATTQVALSEDEARIHNLTVLQFAGTDAGSVLIKKTEVDVSEINPVTGAFYFDFEEPAGGGDSEVYLVANCIGSFPNCEENVTTLGDLQGAYIEKHYLYESAMQSGGLPMIASQCFDVAAVNPAPFKLKSLLAKVVFSYDTTTDFPLQGVSLIIWNLPEHVSITASVPGDAPAHPGYVPSNQYPPFPPGSYNGDPFVVYVPENLSGKMSAITKETDRGGKPGVDVPEGAMYVKLTDTELSSVIFSFYLGDGTPQDFNVVRHHQYNVHVTLRGASTTDKRVELQTANCYIVGADNNADYTFHATVMGNGAITPDVGANAPAIVPATLRPASAKVLWEQSDPTGKTNAVGDVIKNVSLSSDKLYINFTTGTKPGNAVIGAFDDGGTLIWSWHIWRRETDTYYVRCHTPANGGRDFLMMDSNLGAFNNNVNDVKAYGLMYQWGRKDPFPGATGISADDAPGSVTFGGVVTENGYSFTSAEGGITVQGAVQNPMTFYYDASSRYGDNWLQSLNDNLWGNPYTNSSVSPNPALGSKSIYDPCPYGYRVPPQDVWMQVTDANSTEVTNGFQLGVGVGSTPTKHFYPAAGRRWGDTEEGSIGSVGSQGFYWSSSPGYYESLDGGTLYFWLGEELEPKVGLRRANSASVRCTSER